MAKVLIIDDSPTEQYMLQKMAENGGHEAVTSGDAEEGIKMAASEKPDIILMDVVMPGMSGFQATRKLNKDAETSSIPVIIVTTKDQETDRIWGLRQGALDYVTKPVKEKELLAKIKAALG